jgi:hypothetical protein
MTINIGHLASHVDTDESPSLNFLTAIAFTKGLRLVLGSIEDKAEVELDLNYEDAEHQTLAEPSVSDKVSVPLELWGESRPGADTVSRWGKADTAWISFARIIAIQTDQISMWNSRDRAFSSDVMMSPVKAGGG